METLALSVFKVCLIVFASAGLFFHLLVLRNLEKGRQLEQKLGTELGVKKQFIPWLEENRMELQERLIKSKTYNIFSTISLVIVLILATQI